VWPLVGKQHRKASKPNKSTLVELYTEARLKSQLIWSLSAHANMTERRLCHKPKEG
jgi:hypothetical protein